MSHKPIWYLKQLPVEVCDRAVEELLLLPTKDASMGENSEHSNHSQRNTTVRFADSDNWFGFVLHGIGREANQFCQWGYEITNYENVQFAEYGLNQHYDWHIDVFPLGFQEFDRKVSIVCLLSDPSEFEGGELQIKLYDQYTAPLKKGSVIAFPSILEHRVVPVTSGLRRSATVWMNGPKFK